MGAAVTNKMVTITVDSRAVHQMLAGAPGQINRAMYVGMVDATTLLLTLTRRYPPPRAGSRYVRTYTLMRSWSRQIVGTVQTLQGVVASNSAMAPYNRYVMSRADQALVHRGRWATVEDIAEQSQAAINRIFDARLQAGLR